jgi:hypothetical protein
LRHDSLSRNAYCTFGVQIGSVAPDEVANNVLGALTEGSGPWETIFDNQVVIGPVVARVGQDGGEDQVFISDIPTGRGTVTQTSFPPNCAVLVHKRTARGGRRGRGRLFWPWTVQEGQVEENGSIQTSSLTQQQTAANATLTALTANFVPMVLLHSPGLTTAGLPNLVTQLIVDPLISTQRRRLGRR